MRIRLLLAGVAAGLLVAVARACAYMFAIGWCAHRSARAWGRDFDKVFVADRPGIDRRN